MLNINWIICIIISLHGINNIINKAIFSDFVKKVNKLLIIIDSITVNATINDKYCLTFVLLFGDTLFFIFNSLYFCKKKR